MKIATHTGSEEVQTVGKIRVIKGLYFVKIKYSGSVSITEISTGLRLKESIKSWRQAEDYLYAMTDEEIENGIKAAKRALKANRLQFPLNTVQEIENE